VCTIGLISVRPAPAASGEGDASVHEWALEGADGARKGAEGRCGKGGKASHLFGTRLISALSRVPPCSHHPGTTLGGRPLGSLKPRGQRALQRSGAMPQGDHSISITWNTRPNWSMSLVPGNQGRRSSSSATAVSSE